MRQTIVGLASMLNDCTLQIVIGLFNIHPHILSWLLKIMQWL
jgi:hypothetical protein